MGNLRLRQMALLGQRIWKASLGIMSVISLLPRFLMGFTLICLCGLCGYSFLLESKDDWFSSWLREKELEFVKDVSEGVKSLSKDMYLFVTERPERMHQYLVEANVEFVTPELIFTQIKQQELLDFLAENPHLTEDDFYLPEQYLTDYQRYRRSQKEGTYEYMALPENERQALKLPEYASGMFSSFYPRDVFS